MKAGIHPEYTSAKITCACGRVSETFSTVGEIHVEICSHCHPFFTGRQKLVDTAGRVERFKARYGESHMPRSAKKKSKAKDEPVGLEVEPQDSMAEVDEAVSPTDRLSGDADTGDMAPTEDPSGSAKPEPIAEVMDNAASSDEVQTEEERAAAKS